MRFISQFDLKKCLNVRVEARANTKRRQSWFAAGPSWEYLFNYKTVPAVLPIGIIKREIVSQRWFTEAADYTSSEYSQQWLIQAAGLRHGRTVQ